MWYLIWIVTVFVVIKLITGYLVRLESRSNELDNR
jgi:hypothetical protein